MKNPSTLGQRLERRRQQLGLPTQAEIKRQNIKRALEARGIFTKGVAK